MTQLATFVIILFSTLCFSQNTGIIVGEILDKEVAKNPLVLANVSIKGTTIEAQTDTTGLFVLENLEDGDYTLVCSFVGYETKELKVHVAPEKPTNVQLILEASGISLNELALLQKTATNEDKKVTAIK